VPNHTYFFIPKGSKRLAGGRRAPPVGSIGTAAGPSILEGSGKAGDPNSADHVGLAFCDPFGITAHSSASVTGGGAALTAG
jgi:hypothetical protein